jgi:membrane protein YdbS with pleckstrin-like domain
MTTWAFAEILALGGLIFWAAFLIYIEGAARAQKEARGTRQPAAEKQNFESGLLVPDTAENALSNTSPAANRPRERVKNGSSKGIAKEGIDRIVTAATEPGTTGKAGHKGKRVNGWAGFKQACVELALVLPSWFFPLIWVVKIFSALVYLVQIPVTYAVRRLDYEMRWYLVTDRSLRLRFGVWQVSEATMSFANIQQVVVSQGPLQRLLGLADVKVKSAGGGGGGHYNHRAVDMHAGLFHSVSNATEIRNLIQERLRRFREAGLGDPDEKAVVDLLTPAVSHGNGFSAATLSAAREVADEARALRAAITS